VSDQRGAVLVQVVLLLFGIMALAALVVDLGIATLARVAMQGAADAAALEGLRWRDALSDEERRERASGFVALAFDNDLDPSADSRGTGAGPVLRVEGGVGDGDALGTLAMGEPAGYRPRLQLNLDNATAGDLVAGAWDPMATHGEAPDYTRADFDPAGAPDAFLVRLRRTRNASGLDDQPAVASTGPTLPFLFGRAGPMRGGDPGAGYSPRHHGLTVRGTAIASARCALAVGAARVDPDPALAVDGVTSFALSLVLWNALPATVTVEPDGTMTGGPGPGTFGDARQVGRPIVAAGGVPPGSVLRGYVPIYEPLTGRVVGFGTGWMEGTPPGSVQLGKSPSRIAPRNASAVVVGGAMLEGLRLDARGCVLDEGSPAQPLVADPLLVAALVR
jgi:hypothetical protein